MSEFWYTADTMQKLRPDYICFEHFSPIHLAVTAIFFAVIIAAMAVYRRLDEAKRQKFLYVMAVLLILDELWKHIGCLATGQWTWDFLPLHLCSINIFVCVWHSFKRDDLSAEILYALCVPGALLALLMPTWTELPYWNFMSLHSNSVHVLLLMYPMLLLAGGFKPRVKRLKKVFVILFCECAVIFFINKLLDTNFFFLNGTSGNPLLNFFASVFGKDLYILGMPFILALVWAAMYAPWYIAEKKSSKAAA